ncbi:MAG: hypothetical protein GY845_01460 [Planctomycetes bacterium]|nr:hypothetical protein [Planctomycetota bacterium]
MRIKKKNPKKPKKTNVENNMTKTFSNFDKFGLESFADDLTTYLNVESQFVDESFILSLNSEFGSGKSTFFEMWINKLKSDDTFNVVYLNAWESDFQGDPLLAIVSSLLDVLQTDEENEPIKETAGKLCKFALSIGNDVVQKFTGIDVIKAGEYAESNNDKVKKELGHACFQLYEEKGKLFKDLKTLLRDLTKKSKNSIIVIVDELDRCKPNYAIEFLDTIKHFFDIKGLVFVIGVDKKQLASSAKAMFGQELVFDEYYRKFAHRNVNLPVKSETMINRFCQKLAGEYLSKEAFQKKKRFSYAKHDEYRTEEIVDLCISFSLNARQIHEFFRITAHTLSTTQGNQSNRLLWGWQIGTFFMSILSIMNHSWYEKIGKQKMSLSEFTKFLKELNIIKNNSNAFQWGAFLYKGTFLDQPFDLLEKEFQELGIWDSSNKEEGAFQKVISNDNKGAFGYLRGRDPVLSTIYQIMEGLRTFESE